MNYKKNVATVYSVARHAGVSPSTVSRVLSGSEYPVSELARQRVYASASILGYNTGATLKNINRNIAAVVIPNLVNPFYATLIMGLEYSLRLAGMSMLLMNSAGNLDLEKNFVSEIIQKKIPGAIFSPVGDEFEHLKELSKHNIRLLVIEESIDLDCSIVVLNHHNGSFRAIEYLVSRGCQTIGFISSPLTKFSRREVYSGYLAGLAHCGIKKEDRYIRIAESEIRTLGNMTEVYEYQNGMQSAQSLIDANTLPDALLCANDITAFGVMQCFHKNNIKIPEDISIIGFDNTPHSEMTYPRLTTVGQGAYEMGSMSAEILNGIINDANRSNTNVTLEIGLTIRDSVI